MEVFSFIPKIAEEGSTECMFEESIVPNPVTPKTESVEAKSLESVVELAESTSEIELLESLILQKEEIEEMLKMVLCARRDLEFFILDVEDFVKTLEEISKHSDANSRRGNTYLNSIYRKKLVEFASGLLDKVKKSIKDFESDYETLKKHEKKAMETFEKVSEFHKISYPCTAKMGKKFGEELREVIDHLAGKLYLLKPKQFLEIEKVYYIKTDIEMLKDLYLRFSSIEASNLIRF